MSNKSLFEGKKILSLGNPFGAERFFHKYLSKDQAKAIAEQARNSRARYLFVEILGAECFEVLDVSSGEGAEHVFDLNSDLRREVCGEAFQVVLDFGTQEHVFDNSAFLKNVFYFMSRGGCYFFDLPANNYCEHGFRQYSPTFFYDFCSRNCSWLKVSHLSLWSSGIYLDALPLYRKLDRGYGFVVGGEYVRAPREMVSAGAFTGTCISLFNRIHSASNVIGVVSMIHASPDELDMTAIQCLYRSFSLQEVLPQISDSGMVQTRKHLIQSLSRFTKKMLHWLPPKLTIRALALISSRRPDGAAV